MWQSRNVNLHLTPQVDVGEKEEQNKEQYSEFLLPILTIQLHLMPFMISGGGKDEY